MHHNIRHVLIGNLQTPLLVLALLAASPLMLLQGLTVGFLGQGAQALAVGVVALIVFCAVWISMLIEAET